MKNLTKDLIMIFGDEVVHKETGWKGIACQFHLNGSIDVVWDTTTAPDGVRMPDSNVLRREIDYADGRNRKAKAIAGLDAYAIPTPQRRFYIDDMDEVYLDTLNQTYGSVGIISGEVSSLLPKRTKRSEETFLRNLPQPKNYEEE